MNQEEIMRQFGPRMSPENTGEPNLDKPRVFIPDRPQKTLDLHGFTAFDANFEARSFIFRCRDAGLVKVRIVTGRGSTSGTPVLLREIGKLLAELAAAFDWLKFEAKEGYYDILLLP